MASADGTISMKSLGLHCLEPSTNGVCVIFLHGIMSDGESAWGNPSWPRLLAGDMPGTGVFVFSYQTSASSADYSIGDAADNLREWFKIRKLWSTPKIVFVGHSMGGIIARKFILTHQLEFFQKNTEIGLFLIASPSLGSSVAETLAELAWILGHTQVIDLRSSSDNTWLKDLDRDFTNLNARGSLRLVGKELVEDKSTSLVRWLGFSRRIVEPFSAARYFGEPLKVPGTDHRSIAKPEGTGVLQYLSLNGFMLDFVGAHHEDWLPPTDDVQTERAQNAIEGLSAKLPEIAKWHDAVGALQEALIETRIYVESRQAGQARSAGTEMRLSEIWTSVGRALTPHDRTLGALCVVKGQGWADEKLWDDPRFANLSVSLNEMSQRLSTSMLDRNELSRSLVAINNNLDRFEDIRLYETNPSHSPGERPNTGVTHGLADNGDAVEFRGYGDVRKITMDDIANLHREDREAIAASETAMQKLMSEWREIVKKGRLSQADEEARTQIEIQIAEHLDLILAVIEIATGGPLEDHYATQRAIVHQLRQRQQMQSGT
jgi:pimeloyl-ACP methyl ester carboxylesterase